VFRCVIFQGVDACTIEIRTETSGIFEREKSCAVNCCACMINVCVCVLEYTLLAEQASIAADWIFSVRFQKS
jgi:hypothetical protein